MAVPVLQSILHEAVVSSLQQMIPLQSSLPSQKNVGIVSHTMGSLQDNEPLSSQQKKPALHIKPPQSTPRRPPPELDALDELDVPIPLELEPGSPLELLLEPVELLELETISPLELELVCPPVPPWPELTLLVPLPEDELATWFVPPAPEGLPLVGAS